MRNGFTLIEISIVMVIIGLLVAGILTGKEMIRSSEIASVAADADKLKAAIFQFQNQYGALPGDFDKATTIWPGASPAANNGNGNGLIDYNSGAAGEEYYAWQQLSLAGLIPGSFTGAVNSLPLSKVNNAYYRVAYQIGVGNGIYGRIGHYISIAKMDTATGYADSAVLSPVDVYSMDLKFDDGYAPTGGIMGINASLTAKGCVTNNYTTSTTGTYLMTGNALTCSIFFVVTNQ